MPKFIFLLQKYLMIFSLCLCTSVVNTLAQGYFVDEIGREVHLSHSPQRVISLAPNITEMVFALDAGDLMVGVTNYCDFPPGALKKPKVGGIIDPSIETILSLKPDLVLVTVDANKKENVEMLRKSGVECYTINPGNFEGMLSTLQHLGVLLDRQRQAKELVAQLKSRIRKVIDRAAGIRKPSVLILVNTNPPFSAGRDTYLDDFITLAGGVSVTGDLAIHWPQISVEQIMSRAPEVIFVPGSQTPGRNEIELREIQKWTNLPAVQKHQVYFLNADKLLRTGPRLIEVLEEAADLLHHISESSGK